MNSFVHYFECVNLDGKWLLRCAQDILFGGGTLVTKKCVSQEGVQTNFNKFQQFFLSKLFQKKHKASSFFNVVAKFFEKKCDFCLKTFIFLPSVFLEGASLISL